MKVVSKPDPLLSKIAESWAACYAEEFRRRLAAELVIEELRAQLDTALTLNREYRAEFIRMKERERELEREKKEAARHENTSKPGVFRV